MSVYFEMIGFFYTVQQTRNLPASVNCHNFINTCGDLLSFCLASDLVHNKIKMGARS